MIARPMAARGVLALGLAAVLATAGCAAGRDAGTTNQFSSQDGTDANVGSMALRGIALDAPSTGDFYPSGSSVRMRIVLVNNGTRVEHLTNIVTTSARGWAAYPSAAQARAALAAGASRQLPGGSGPSASTTPGVPSSGSSSTSPADSTSGTSGATSASSSVAAAPTGSTDVAIQPGQRTSFGVPDSPRVLVLRSTVGRVYPGTSMKIRFTFSRSGTISVVVPVQVSANPGDATIPAPSTTEPD